MEEESGLLEDNRGEKGEERREREKKKSRERKIRHASTL